MGGGYLLSRGMEWIAYSAAVLASLALGYLVVKDPNLVVREISVSPESLIGLVVGLILATLIVRRPGFALILVVGMVYLHLSQLLVRYHGLPSVLQLLSVPLFMAAVTSPGRGILGIFKHPLTGLLLLYNLVLLLSTTYAQATELADERFVENLKAFGIFLLVVMLVTSRARMRLGVWTLIVVGASLASLAVWQMLTGNFGNDYGGLARIKQAHIYGEVFEPRIAGPLGDPNFFAQILLILVPLAFFIAWPRSC
jgi:hypothetical protein